MFIIFITTTQSLIRYLSQTLLTPTLYSHHQGNWGCHEGQDHGLRCPSFPGL